MIIAARALGLDCGPMSGFDNLKLDEEFFSTGKCEECEQEFFSAGHVKSNFLCNIGCGDPAKLMPRGAPARLQRGMHVSGSLVFDPENLALSLADVAIDAEAIWTGQPQRDAHLRSADFLDVENHPRVIFTLVGRGGGQNGSTRVRGCEPDSSQTRGSTTTI